jgi:hypothetical protein
MLPARKSSPVPRGSAIKAVEIRVPSLGMAFTALASSIGPSGAFLTTFVELAVGTPVIAALSLADGPAIVDGRVIAQGDAAGLGIAIEFHDVDDEMRSRLAVTPVSSSNSVPAAPAARVA